MNKKNINLYKNAKFNNLSKWWDSNGEFKFLHQINPLRLDYILNRSNGLFGKKVLDIGCGGGILTESMAREGADVTGLDIDEESLINAKIHALKKNISINYIQQTVNKHVETHSLIYDTITCMEVLEHAIDPVSIVRGCASLIKPEGDVFFSTINRTIKAWLVTIIGAEYILRYIPCGTHNINKFIKPSELLNWLDETSLYEQHIIGLCFNPLKYRFYLSKNININYLIHARRSK